MSSSPVTRTTSERSISSKIWSYVFGDEYESMPLRSDVDALGIEWKNDGIAFVTNSMYFVPVGSSGFSAARVCASDPSTYANVSQPFMKNIWYFPLTHLPMRASARTFCPRPAWPLYAMMSAVGVSAS